MKSVPCAGLEIILASLLVYKVLAGPASNGRAQQLAVIARLSSCKHRLRLRDHRVLRVEVSKIILNVSHCVTHFLRPSGLSVYGDLGLISNSLRISCRSELSN